MHYQVHLHCVELINFKDTISATKHISLAIIHEQYASQYIKFIFWKFELWAKMFYFLVHNFNCISPSSLSLSLSTQIKKYFFALTLRTRCIHYSTFRSHTTTRNFDYLLFALVVTFLDNGIIYDHEPKLL